MSIGVKYSLFFPLVFVKHAQEFQLFYLFILKFGNLLIINKLTYCLGRAFLSTTTWFAISTQHWRCNATNVKFFIFILRIKYEFV
jgi:hypothetical protein